MNTILDKIVRQTREDLQKRKREVSLKDLESFEHFEKPVSSLFNALSKPDKISVIAEVKKASPSKGIIREKFDPVSIAMSYEDAGAAAISVLTDEPFFQGSLSYLEAIAFKTVIPKLRKDFIIDPYQVKEAKAFGADAILIITTITSGRQMNELLHAAQEFGLECLVECYSADEVETLNFDDITILGVNNRDLKSFEVDVHRGISLLNEAPDHVVKVSESGLSSPEDLRLLMKEGIDAALIGEHLMRQEHPGEYLKILIDETHST